MSAIFKIIKIGAMKDLLLLIYGDIVLTVKPMVLQFERYTTLQLYIYMYIYLIYIHVHMYIYIFVIYIHIYNIPKRLHGVEI